MDLERIFESSFERATTAEHNGVPFFEYFYDLFVNSDQRIADKFSNTDMEAQRNMLRKSFYSLFSFYVSSDTDYLLQKVAASHSREHLDIQPELYDIWLECLIRVAREYDPEFDDEAELSWRLVLAPGIVFMKFYYDHDAPA